MSRYDKSGEMLDKKSRNDIFRSTENGVNATIKDLVALNVLKRA